MSTNIRFLGLLALCLVQLGCVTSPGPSGPPRVTTLLGGQRGYELVKIPALARVWAYRVAPAGQPGTGETIGGTSVTAGPTAAAGQSLSRLSSLLTAEDTYAWGQAKRCDFHPEIAIRFTGARKTIDLIFCFKCNQLRVYEDERQVGAADFDPRAAEVKAAVNAAFGEANDSK